tara:strand:+ start:612 stop:1010 length:399 start_codon:yes stop_codon:yes gene_type:complete
MGWENIIKRKNAPYGDRTSAEKTQERKRKSNIQSLQKQIDALKSRRDSLQSTYDSKRPNEKVWSQRNIEPIKYIKEGNHKRKATKEEQDDYLKRAYAKQEKKFIDFERKYKSKIHALDNQIEKLEAELKELK